MSDRRRVAAIFTALAVTIAACGGATTTERPDGSAVADSDSAAPSGPAVPDAEVDDFDGQAVSLSDHVGTPLVVNFWASWCPPCIAEMPDLEAVHQAAAGEVTFIGINTQDTAERAEALVDETGVSYQLLRDPDGDLFQAFGVFGMPSTFYVDADGTIVDRHTGLLTRDALVDDLRDHLGVEAEVPS
jgi:cytochrome c biogenesis protein CcmG, thiol:disulfide interchange protein DsbE